MIWIKNTSTILDAASIDIFGGPLTGFFRPWSAREVPNRLGKDGELILVAPDAAGFAVVNPTETLLDIKNNHGTQTLNYELLIIGVRN